ncbi:MAG TPA: translation initiation factor IF-2 N-terminal domain-containing protein, partial [Pseudobacillus sp.]
MSKQRVHEYAKEKNVSSKVVIEKLKELNVEVSNHMTVIDEEAIQKLEKSFENTNKQTKSNQSNQS